jgi:ketosteroid isomerase-like protein
MSQEAIKTIRDAAAAFNRGDVDAWLEYVADDIDHRAAEGAPDDPGPMHGKDAVRAYVQDWLPALNGVGRPSPACASAIPLLARY